MCLYMYIYYVSIYVYIYIYVYIDTHIQASILEHQKEQQMLEAKVGELEKANVALRSEGDATQKQAQKAVSELQGRLEKAEIFKSLRPTLIST
jgi:hypothetical protein